MIYTVGAPVWYAATDRFRYAATVLEEPREIWGRAFVRIRIRATEHGKVAVEQRDTFVAVDRLSPRYLNPKELAMSVAVLAARACLDGALEIAEDLDAILRSLPGVATVTNVEPEGVA